MRGRADCIRDESGLIGNPGAVILSALPSGATLARILSLTTEFPPFRGGIGAVALGLARGAAGLGHDVTVLAPDFRSDNAAEDAALPFAVRRFHGKSISVVSTDGVIGHTRRVYRTIRELSPDIVHAIDPASQMALAMLARLRLIGRHFSTVHGTELLRYRRELYLRLWMAGAFRRATAVCAVSHAVRDRLIDPFRCDPARVFVSHPGIAEEWRAAPRSDRAAIRTAWDAGDDDVVLLTLARRVPEKGHLEVIEALARLPAGTRRRIAYVVAGSGPEPFAARLVEAADRSAVRLHLSGRVSDEQAIALMDAADAFVMLSRETATRLEGLGLAYIEAAARSLPSLARDTGGVRDAVLDGETGIVLPASAGAGETAAAIERLASDAALRSRMGAAAARFGAAFTHERHAREVYDRFLAA
jgi:glycosyltransferase involved in cell wall biosynthesis